MKQSKKLETIITYVAPLKFGHRSSQWELEACVKEIYPSNLYKLHNFNTR